MPPRFGFGWWEKDQYAWEPDLEVAGREIGAFNETLTMEQADAQAKPALNRKNHLIRVAARCTERPSSAGCWLLDGPSVRLVKLTDLFDVFRNRFTARELVDFYLALPIYIRKRQHETAAKRARVDQAVGARKDIVAISVNAATDLLRNAGLPADKIPETPEAIRNVSRGLRRALLRHESALIGGSSHVEFVAFNLLPKFILDRMWGCKAGDVATTRVMLFCPNVLRVKRDDGTVVEGICFRTAADVTAQFNLKHLGKTVNGFYCHKCAQKKETPPPPCRLLYVWWQNMPQDHLPIQLVLMDIGGQQLRAQGSSPADPSPQLGERLSQEGRGGKISDKVVRAGQKNVTRIRLTGEISRALWERLCTIGNHAVDRRGRPGDARTSTD